MLGQILAAFSVIKELIALIKMLFRWKNEMQAREAEQKAVEREKAAEALKNAQTEEEFNNASDRLHGNSH